MSHEESSLSPTQAPLKELIERRLELSEELRNGLAGVIAKQDEELKLLRAKVSALSPHPPTSEDLVCDQKNRTPENLALYGCTGNGRPSCQATECMFGVAVVEGRMVAAKGSPHPPTSQPEDARGRFMLNAYGRQCYDLGRAAALKGLSRESSEECK